MNRQPRAMVCAACLAVTLAGTGCTAAGSGQGQPAPGVTVADRPVIVVGSFNFPESIMLAYLYGDALADRGYPVRVLPGLGPRELVDPVYSGTSWIRPVISAGSTSSRGPRPGSTRTG